MTDRFQKHFVSLTFLFLLLLRILIYGASIGDSIAFLALSAFTVYSLYIQNKNRDTDLAFKNQLNELENKLSLLKLDLGQQLYDELIVLKEKLDEKDSNNQTNLDNLQNELNAVRQQVGLIKVDQGFQTKPNPNVMKAVSAEKKKYF